MLSVKEKREKKRICSKKYYDEHKNDPAYMDRKRKIDKKYRDKNKDDPVYKKKQSAKVCNHYMKIKIIVFNHYSNNDIKCACCGFRDIKALTIDHKNGNGNKHRKEIGTFTCTYLYKNNFPKGYQILCYSCNCAKGNKKKCPLDHNMY